MVETSFSVAIAVCVIGSVCFALAIGRLVRRHEELGRFDDTKKTHYWSFVVANFERLIRRQLNASGAVQGRFLVSPLELQRLGELGVSEEEAVLRYVFLREVWIGITVAVSFYSLTMHTPLFAVLFTCGALILAIWVPRGLLDLRWEARRRALRLEIPIVFGLLDAGVRSSAEVVGVFNDYADILYGKQQKGSLSNCLRKAKWDSRVAGSWACGLAQVRGRMPQGSLQSEAVGELEAVMQPDCDEVAEKLAHLVSCAHERLSAELVEHQRLVSAKVTVLMAACVVGCLLINSFPF